MRLNTVDSLFHRLFSCEGSDVLNVANILSYVLAFSLHYLAAAPSCVYLFILTFVLTCVLFSCLLFSYHTLVFLFFKTVIAILLLQSDRFENEIINFSLLYLETCDQKCLLYCQ